MDTDNSNHFDLVVLMLLLPVMASGRQEAQAVGFMFVVTHDNNHDTALGSIYLGKLTAPVVGEKIRFGFMQNGP